MNIGQQLSHYIIEGKIGDGGFGDVFRARDMQSGMQVAIKCSRPGDSALPDQQQRFMREVSCSSKLSHPNIVQVYEYGALPDGTLYLVMEFVGGDNLEGIIKRYAPLNFDYATGIVLQVLDALSEAHKHAIIHRDLKPANMMIQHQGKGRPDTVKLLDFGIAKAFDGTQPDLTRQFFQNSVGFGTPQYMPPEQFFGKNLGPHSDLYAIGLVYYELLTGSQAFSGKTLSEIIQRQLKEFPNIPSPFNDGPLNDVFRKALAKDVSMRYSNAREMHNDLIQIFNSGGRWLNSYRSASSSVPYADENDRSLTNVVSEYAGDIDISSFNTVLFEKPVEEDYNADRIHDDAFGMATVDSSSGMGFENYGYDEFEEEFDGEPTDDMSRISEAAVLGPEGTVPSDKYNSYSPYGLPPAKRAQNEITQPATVDLAAAPAPYSAEYGVLTQAVKQPRMLLPETRVTDADDVMGEAKTIMADALDNVDPDFAKTNDMAALNPPKRTADDDDPPPIFHQQRTQFLRNHMINQSVMKETVLGNQGFFSRLFMSERLIRLRASAPGRFLHDAKSRFAKFMDTLYQFHFGVLVTAICLLIIIVAAIVMIIVVGKAK